MERSQRERVRAHEWDLLDNVSFLREIVEMVTRDRCKCDIFEVHPPDTHRGDGFL